MTLARDRPAAIRLFGALCLAAAFLGLVEGLRDFGALGPGLQLRSPEFEGSRAMAVSLICARLSVALIPAALIWFLASRFARWMVAFFAALKAAATAYGVVTFGVRPFVEPFGLATLALGTMAAALLFVPSAGRWFADRGERIDNVFA